jgi:hypothetical protein
MDVTEHLHPGDIDSCFFFVTEILWPKATHTALGGEYTLVINTCVG